MASISGSFSRRRGARVTHGPPGSPASQTISPRRHPSCGQRVAPRIRRPEEPVPRPMRMSNTEEAMPDANRHRQPCNGAGRASAPTGSDSSTASNAARASRSRWVIGGRTARWSSPASSPQPRPAKPPSSNSPPPGTASPRRKHAVAGFLRRRGAGGPQLPERRSAPPAQGEGRAGRPSCARALGLGAERSDAQPMNQTCLGAFTATR
jgi:hypothetical protein